MKLFYCATCLETFSEDNIADEPVAACACIEEAARSGYPPKVESKERWFIFESSHQLSKAEVKELLAQHQFDLGPA